MLLGDIGGFQGILFAVAAGLVGLFTHNNPENYLARKLYMPVDQTPTANNKSNKEHELKPSNQYALIEFL